MTRAQAARSLQLFAHVVRIADALDFAVAIKGPVLAHVLYGDISRRNYLDVDFLIPRHRVREAADQLRSLGFTPVIAVEEHALRKHFEKQHDLAFLHEDGTLLELHVDIAQPHYSYRVDIDSWLQRSTSITINGKALKALALDDAALLSIIHGTKHAWAQLDLIEDVAAFNGAGVDWQEVTSQAERVGAKRALQVAGELSILACSVVIPVSTSPTAKSLANQVWQRLATGTAPGYWPTRLFDLRIRERFSDRFRYVARLGLGLKV